MNTDKPTARRVAEAALDRYIDLYDFAPIAYFTLRSNGEIVRTNLVGARMLGQERGRLTGLGLGSFLTEATLSAFNTLLLQVFVDETPQRCEAALMHEDHSLRIVQIEATLSSKRDECHLVVLDITERKQTEDALRKSEARLRAIIQTEPECVKVVSPEGWLLEMNPAGLAMLEAGSLEDAQKKPLLQFIAPECRAAFGGLHKRVMRGTDGALEFEVIGLKGARRWLETHATPLRDPSGQVEALLGITRDITERKRAEQWQQQYSRVLAMISAEASLPFVLEQLVRFVEKQSEGAICSILLLSDDGLRLTHGAAPSLPDFYINAIDGGAIGPTAGSCGAAAALAQAVIAEDIQTSPNWTAWREIAAQAGLRACWSTPIFSSERKVMGTFALYHGEPWSPTPDDEELLRRAASLAALAIDRARHQDAQRLANTVLQENVEGVMVTSPDGY